MYRRPTPVLHKSVICLLSMLCTWSRVTASGRGSGWGVIVVPRQISMIAQFPGLDEVSSGKEHSQDDADTSYDEICNSEEGVLAAHHSAG